MMHIGMDWIDKHHPHHLFAMPRGEHAHVERTIFEGNEKIRARNSSAGEKAIEFLGNIRTGAWLVRCVAPAKAGAIIGTNTSKSRNLRLNQLPHNQGIVWTSLHDDGGSPHASAVDVKTQPADVDELPARRIAMVVPYGHDELKYGTGRDKQGHYRNEPFQDTT